MKKTLVFTVLALFCVSNACVECVAGLSLPGLGALPENVTISPFAQVGFQRVGSNMNLPVNSQPLGGGTLQINQIDISLNDANLWGGTAGVTIKSGELFSLFASAGGSLKRPFVVTGQIPVVVDLSPVEPVLDFTARNMEMWFAQGGMSLGPILLGLYGDHFGITVDDPRRGSTPIANQTLRGDVISTTLAPYIGIAIPASAGLLTIIYSPLATSNTTLVLRTSSQDLAQAQYKWNKPGNFLSSTFQYNMAPIDSFTLGVWGNYTWMDVRGNAQLDFQDSTLGFSTQKDVTATMTKYVLQGGISLNVAF